MAGFDRKMLALLKPNSLDKALIVLEKSASICFTCSPGKCPYKCRYVMLPPPPPPIVTGDKYQMPSYFILMICVLGAIFVFICYIITLRRYKYNSRSRASHPSLFENGEDFIDENHGPVLDHPIWYIRTAGLPQNIIDSIAVFKYKKYEALIEGTDCSVCLSEFEEDESLKLLPKCSHAFHIHCIDTWLRSHKNCPLCRAPIVSDMAQMNNVEISITNVDDTSPNVVHQTENGTTSDQPENLEFSEEGSRETSVEVENLDALPIEEGSMMCTLKGKSSVLDERMEGVRVSSDLEQNHETRLGVEYVDALPVDEGRRIGIWGRIPSVLDEWKKGVRVSSDLAEHRVKVMQELQPPRRSVSMDSSTVQVSHVDVSDMSVANSERCCSSNDQVAEGKKIESSGVMIKEGNRNSSLSKAVKSSSFGLSLHRVPIGMKRSFSTSKNQDLRQTL